MITHILKLLWNKRKSNAMMVLEIMLSFMVLFAVLTFILNNYIKYKSPLGFDTQDINAVHLSFNQELDSAQLLETQVLLKQALLQNKNITNVAFSTWMLPFSGSTSSTSNDDNGFQLRTKLADYGEDFFETMGVKIIKGRAFSEEDVGTKYEPIMISKNFKEEYYPDKEVLDSLLLFGNDEYKICGIFEHFKYQSEFAEEGNIVFFYLPLGDKDASSLLFRVNSGTPASFEEEVNKTIAGVLKNNDFVIQNMDNQRKRNSADIWIPMIALLFISIFLCINVGLGLFGVLWQNISKRRGEIGLRRALGAHTTSISFQITAEILIVTFVGLLIGAFFAIQFPLLKVFDFENSIYFYAMAISAGVILILVLLCALYPSRMAARIHPAVALHDE